MRWAKFKNISCGQLDKFKLESGRCSVDALVALKPPDRSISLDDRNLFGHLKTHTAMWVN